MATVHEGCTTKQRHYVVDILWAKGLTAKDMHKEMFPVYGGMCLSRKATLVADIFMMMKRLK